MAESTQTPEDNPWLSQLNDHKVQTKHNSVSDFYRQIRQIEKRAKEDPLPPAEPQRSTFAQIFLQENLAVTVGLEEFEPEFAAAV